MDSKRYSIEEAKLIIAGMKKNDLDELHLLFSKGAVPLFEDINGKTAGVFLAWNPVNPWFVELSVRILFDSPLGRWTGKEFQDNRGVNLFKNHLWPKRFRFDTYVKNAYSDKKPCLALDYRPYFSLMSGLVDDVRKIEEGVFLGQMYHKFLWQKEPQFLGYFLLCSIST